MATFRSSHRPFAVHEWVNRTRWKPQMWWKSETWFLPKYSEWTTKASAANVPYLYHFFALLSANPTCGFYTFSTFFTIFLLLQFQWLFSFISVWRACLHRFNWKSQQLKMQVSSNMEGQLVINRPDSPVITIITTTSYNPGQSLTSAIHSAVSQCNSLQMNGQFIGNKGLTIHEQQGSKHRICRDFVRGSCRRLYCKYPHVQSTDQVVFCHDFQNNKCPRINCKWVIFALDPWIVSYLSLLF